MHWNEVLPVESEARKWPRVSICNKNNRTFYLGDIVSCICAFLQEQIDIYIDFLSIFLYSDVSHDSVVYSLSLNLFIYLRGFFAPETPKACTW